MGSSADDQPRTGLPVVAQLALGAAFGVVLAASGIGGTLVPVVFGVYWLAVAISWLFSKMRPPGSSLVTVQCARCAAQPRTTTGFCLGCTNVLEASPLPPSHPAYPAIQALERGDLAAAAPALAPRLKRRKSGGSEDVLSKRAWLRELRSANRRYRTHGTILGLYLDPANADNVWVRTHERSEDRFGGPGIDHLAVFRYRMPHQQIVEVEIYYEQPSTTSAAADRAALAAVPRPPIPSAAPSPPLQPPSNSVGPPPRR